MFKFSLCVPLNNYKILTAARSQLFQPKMVTMADTAFRDPDVELVPRASVPATEYAQYKAIRDKFKRDALGQLESAIRASTVATLDGLPYPAKFRNQGALDEWECLFKAHDWSQRMWNAWATARSTCLDCINELCWQVDQRLHSHPRSQRPPDWPDTAFATVVRWAANIHFERKRGALIETTPALDALLMHSDIDDTLPMHLFSPPFSAQYLRLNHATAEHFRTTEDYAKQRSIDGIFCFVSKPGSSDDSNKFIPVIELVIIYATKDKGIRAQLLRGPMITANETVTQWADAILVPQGRQRTPEDDVLMKLISNMVKVFLYLGLKDARREMSPEHSDALKRLAAVGPKKQAKLQRRLDSLYDHITVGPADAPTSPPALGTIGTRAPHWRRGHFRAQACGPARSLRKLIFVAPILIHADRLGGQVPPLKAYELTTGRIRASRAASGQQQTK